MSNPSGALAEPNPSGCSDCGEVHPRGCPSHVVECTACVWRGGNVVGRPCIQCGGVVRARACRDAPIKGGPVCSHHGGSAPQVRAAADRQLVEEGATKELGKVKVRPIGDPVVAIGELAAEAIAFFEGAKANAVEGQVDGAWMAFAERSLERAGKLLAAAGRLGLEERRIRLEEAQLDLAAAVIVGVLTRLDVDVDEPRVQEALDATYAELAP